MTTATAERRRTRTAPPHRKSPTPDAAPDSAAPAVFDAPDSDTAPTGGLGLHHLAPILRGTPEYQDLLTALTDITPSARAQTMPDSVPYLLATLLQDLRLPALIVAPRPEDAPTPARAANRVDAGTPPASTSSRKPRRCRSSGCTPTLTPFSNASASWTRCWTDQTSWARPPQ